MYQMFYMKMMPRDEQVQIESFDQMFQFSWLFWGICSYRLILKVCMQNVYLNIGKRLVEKSRLHIKELLWKWIWSKSVLKEQTCEIYKYFKTANIIATILIFSVTKFSINLASKFVTEL